MKTLLPLQSGAYLVVEEAFAASLADVIANSRVVLAHEKANTYIETKDASFIPTTYFAHESDIEYLPEIVEID